MGRLSEPEAESPPWGFLEVTNAVSALIIATFLIGSVIGLTISGDQVNPLALLSGWTVGSLITIGYIYLTRRRSPQSVNAMHLGPSPNPMLFYALLGVAAAISVSLGAFFGSGQFLTVSELSSLIRSQSVLDWILAGAFLILAQPIAEELVFRSIMLPKLRYALGPWAGLMSMAAFYSLYHFLLYGATLTGSATLWYGIVQPLFMAIFYGGVYIVTRSTRAAIAAHAGAGLFSLLAAIVLVS